MTATVRPLQDDDREAWLGLWRAYLRFYQAEVADDVTGETWRRVLDPDGPIQGLGALDADGRLVGFTLFLFHPGTWTSAPRCYLEDLFVAEESRGAGAGRALIEGVHARAKAAGAEYVYWHTDETNRTARQLYDRVAELTPYVRYRKD